jgi:hypothetical protein
VSEETESSGCAVFLAGGVIAIFILFAIGVLSLWWSRTSAPIAEETRRITYEEGASYRQGVAIDLDNLCRQWRSNRSPAIADTIRLRLAHFDINNLPSQVRQCVEEVQ